MSTIKRQAIFLGIVFGSVATAAFLGGQDDTQDYQITETVSEPEHLYNTGVSDLPPQLTLGGGHIVFVDKNTGEQKIFDEGRTTIVPFPEAR